MTDRVAIRRLPTGVPGLDQILGGGLPEFSFNLIAGTPGAGKTTLAQQIMFALSGPDPGRPSVSQAPPGRTCPPFVATSTPSRRPRSAFAIRRSLWPKSSSPRQYASAVSMSRTPASRAAWIVATERSSSGRPVTDMGMAPRPMGNRATSPRVRSLVC